MPLRGFGHSQLVQDADPYFESLSQLDEWSDRSESAKKLSGVLPYAARSRSTSGESNGGKLLVCHDYKGGYTEKPSAPAYTFNFWSVCETFVYFSHHRVTVPPSGWISAAHRQGVRMLGTLIFEGSAEADCLQLLFGRLPGSVTGPAASSPSSTATNMFPVSPHYARVLAQLARQRGFDGYLLNFECPLRAGPEQSRALSAWISLLRSELRAEVGSHAQVVWYDSVVYTGELRWQDRLNNYNLPFFPPSDGFFSNYTWPPHYPQITAQYFSNLSLQDKAMGEVYMGIDVWGRGSYGDGGFGSYRALERIDPKSLGLSAALFGQAWTWESEQDKPGWSWDAWWKYERMLWLGPEPGEVAPVPPMSELSLRKQAAASGVSSPGPFVPISLFFDNLPAPDPLVLPFFTSFCPGVGWRWFIEGSEVMVTESGWTDVQKQSSLGNLLWPRPAPQWEESGGQGELPKASTSLNMGDGWLGGGSLRVALDFHGDEEAYFRCVWIPVQSLNIGAGTSYDASLVYKTDSPVADLEIAVSVRSLVEFEISSMSSKELKSGWTELHVKFNLTKGVQEVEASVGLIVGCATEDPSIPCQFSMLLGQLVVAPTTPTPTPRLFAYIPKILWADYNDSVLTWEIAASFDPMSPSLLIPMKVDDPTQIWEIPPPSFFPSFMYFNVYVERMSSTGFYLGPEKAEFIGTTGWDGRANRFYVDKALLPENLSSGGSSVRFYIQGVTDRGQVLDWTQSVFVDAKLQF